MDAELAKNKSLNKKRKSLRLFVNIEPDQGEADQPAQLTVERL